MSIRPRSTGPGTGQAILEHLGIVLIVAVVVAASVWAAGELRPPDRPPGFVQRAAAPLSQPATPAGPPAIPTGRPASPFSTWPYPLPRGPRRASIFRRALRVAGRIVRVSGETGFVFGKAFVLRLKDRAVMLVRHPERFITDFVDQIRHLEEDPIGTLGGDQIQRVRDYVRLLRSLPPREAVRRLAEDAGSFGADIVIDVVTRAAARRIAARLPGGSPPPAPPPTPPTP